MLMWLYVWKSKFQKSYKDIEDEKFQEVIDYIEFLKKKSKLENLINLNR